MSSPGSPYPGLDLIATAVVLVGDGLRIRHVNSAAEHLFGLSGRNVVGHRVEEVFAEGASLVRALHYALSRNSGFTDHEFALSTGPEGSRLLSCTVTPVEAPGVAASLEFNPLDQPLRIVREEHTWLQSEANRELLRNLAHEIKNPLGGIRGAAQLLEHELARPSLKEYTQVVIKEADRLQQLMDRLLMPHRPSRVARVNLHEALERVRSLLLAEAPGTLKIRRDYDTSLPELEGDREQLIQAVLNIARNSAQALEGKGTIIFRTRVARGVTLAKRRRRLAIALEIIDDGPGIAPEIRERIFYPLVSGREAGTGLGLSIAQTFVGQHHGSIECDSRPGHTCFTVLLPLPDDV
ncbi:MAG: nitrogen regulation protein NR(II) [Betaproteobacteria bacterium]|nr:nitrogen regulation protein NR(II) [Betaproteobacteria bacterium]